MKVALGTFACSGIETLLGGDIAAGVRAALGRYAERGGRGELELARMVISRHPEYLRPRIGAEVDLTLDPEVEAALEREVRKSGGASVDQVVAHAVLAYLADLDSALELDARPLTQVYPLTQV